MTKLERQNLEDKREILVELINKSMSTLDITIYLQFLREVEEKLANG